MGERVGPIARAADRGGERGHEERERIALLAPVEMDLPERILLAQHADADILLPRAVGLEQPGIGVLPLQDARLGDLLARRAFMILEIGGEPELKRMDAREIGAVGERVFLDRGVVVQAGERLGRQLRLGQRLGQEQSRRSASDASGRTVR